MRSRSVDSQPPEAAWSDAERELLGAGREERMPVELEARMRDALAFAPSTADVPNNASVSFNDTARARQLFAGKLSLWGMLGIVALGAIGYYALNRGASQPTAADATPAHLAASRREGTAQESASAQRDGVGSAAGTRREAASAQRDGIGPASASVHAGARLDGANAQREVDGAASASAQAGARRGATTEREAVSAQSGGAARGLANARNGKRAEASSLRPRAATSGESRDAPPMAAAHAAGSEDSRAHEPTNESADAAQSGKFATPDQLRLEAQLLEHARSALGHGALPEARQWLARYQAEFARGALQPESQVLGIELAVRTGARTKAKAQAEQFLARHPHHPLRDRVQLLTEEPR